MADPLQTLRDQLASVRAAIRTAEGVGQSVAVVGRTTEMGDLRTLYSREKDLIRRINRLARRGRIRSGRVFGR
jgi:hypothetical protein